MCRELFDFSSQPRLFFSFYGPRNSMGSSKPPTIGPYSHSVCRLLVIQILGLWTNSRCFWVTSRAQEGNSASECVLRWGEPNMYRRSKCVLSVGTFCFPSLSPPDEEHLNAHSLKSLWVLQLLGGAAPTDRLLSINTNSGSVTAESDKRLIYRRESTNSSSSTASEWVRELCIIL